MILFHTSYVTVENPDVAHSRDFLDFGKGFYLTTLRDQAVRYGQRFLRRQGVAWLNSYKFEYEPKEWKVKTFDAYDQEWLDFVAACRAGKDGCDYDLVIGGIANDKVIRTLDRYFEKEITKDEALGLLRYEKPNIQFCIRSQKMLEECLTHMESLKI